jgi:peptidoglycan/xylan/chitin deacetylase (PgdA/CDA1 family)
MATTKARFAQDDIAAAVPTDQGRAPTQAVPAAAALPNGFSVDLEDGATLLWRMISGEWTEPGAALGRQIDWILETLESAGATGTFFTVGDLARQRPALIRRIVAAGHEIGCHGLFHDSLDELGETAFRADIREARAILSDVAGQTVEGYRAPFFSLRAEMDWAHRVLAEEGFRYDASVLGAGPGLPRRLPGGLWESALTEVRWCGRSWPYGGAWLAALPACAAAPPPSGGTIFYMHPYNVGWNRLKRAGSRSPRALWMRCRHEQVHNLLAPRFRARLADLLGHGRWQPIARLVARAEAR